MLQNAPADCWFACFFACFYGWFDCLVVFWASGLLSWDPARETDQGSLDGVSGCYTSASNPEHPQNNPRTSPERPQNNPRMTLERPQSTPRTSPEQPWNSSRKAPEQPQNNPRTTLEQPQNFVTSGAQKQVPKSMPKTEPGLLPTLCNCVSTYLKIEQHATSSMRS